MEINRYIKDLLLEHDCVVVPGLGGFIGSPIAAEVQTVTKTINPPGKRISFNAQLQRNDGLLVHHIAYVEGMSYDDAEQAVQQFVKNSKKRLEQSGLIMFPEVGKLMADHEGTMSFYPTPGRNLLQESFGLKPVHYRQTYNTVTQTIENPVSAPLQPVRSGPGKARRFIGTYGVSIAAMLVLGIFIAQEIYIQPLSLDKFSFFSPPALFTTGEAIPNTKHATIAHEPVLPGTMEVTGTLEIDDNEVLVVTEIEEPATVSENVATPEPVPTKATTPAPHITQINANDVGAGYYVILGAYSSQANANKFIKEQKYLTGLVTIPSNGLLRVALPVGENADAAYQQLEKQRQQDHPAAWLILNQK